MDSGRQNSWPAVRSSLSGPLGVLALVTLAVYLILLVRILASAFFGPPPSLLLSTALQGEVGRLNEIATGPCNSTEMQQFQRGEIGPVPFAEPPASQAAPVTRQPAADATPSQTPSGTPQASGQSDHALGGEELRQLVQRSVVRVLTETGSGTGFAIAPNLVVTNRHVIEGAASGSIVVTSKFLGPSPVVANPVAVSPDSEVGNADFAVLELQGAGGLVPVSLGTDPKPLDSVIAAGFPAISVRSDPDEINPDVVFSQGDVSVVQAQPNGVGLVIHTANIAPGSSGGPLLNRCGIVVGINTFVGTGDEAEGRALYSLSPEALRAYLSSEGIAFQSAVATCASGGA